MELELDYENLERNMKRYLRKSIENRRNIYNSKF